MSASTHTHGDKKGRGLGFFVAASLLAMAAVFSAQPAIA